MNKRTRLTLLALATLIMLPVLAHAQAGPLRPDQCGVLGLACAGGIDGFIANIISIINVVLGFMGLVATIYVMYGGFLYISAKGDDKQLERAKSTILYAVVGLIVIGLSITIATFIIPYLT